MTKAFRLTALVASVALGFSAVGAEARVSLDTIDAKLDQLLAAGGGGASFDPSQLVVLNLTVNATTSCSLSRAFHRLNPDGGQEAAEFTVPNGYTLLVTDMNWSVFQSPTVFSAGRTLRFNLSTENPAGNTTQVYQSGGVEITAATVNARLGGEAALSSGVSFAAGHQICASAGSYTQSGFAAHTPAAARLYGILIPNSN